MCTLAARLSTIKLDVTRPEDSQAAIAAAVGRFGRIEVLVNNAGNFYAGFFEELGPEQVRNQIETLLFGPMNVTRAALPVMRKQRSGLPFDWMVLAIICQKASQLFGGVKCSVV